MHINDGDLMVMMVMLMMMMMMRMLKMVKKGVDHAIQILTNDHQILVLS